MKDVIMTDTEIKCNLNTLINIIGGKHVMSKHFLAIMFLVFIAAGTYSQSIPSGTGRHTALGNSPFILDASVDIFNNPAWNNYYRDYAFGDLNQNGESNDFDGNAGVTFAVGKKWNLGMIINRRSDLFGLFSIDTLRPSNSPIVPFMGLVGTSLNKNFHVGLAPYLSMGKAEFTDTTGATTIKNTSSSIGANLGFMYMMKKGWIEGAIRFRMNGFKNEFVTGGVTSTTENTGGMELGVALRGWFYGKSSNKVAIVPVLGFSTYSFQPKSTSGSTSVTGLNYSFMNISGGVGLNWPIMDDIQIAGGVTVAYNTSKSDSGAVENKNTDFIAPAFNMALETRITDWLTARMGFNKSITSNKFENNTQTFSNLIASSSASTINLGAGFHFGRFSIDATVSERWLKQGVYFISGANSGNNTDMFGMISASYNFAK
jgi:hypothetical protein